MTVAYRPDFSVKQAHPSGLYYGVSIAGWRSFFEGQGYQFVTVDQNGVNAFFIDPKCFEAPFLERIQGLSFVENRAQLRKFRVSCEDQFSLIADREFISI
jgi:hypothetical protein